MESQVSNAVAAAVLKTELHMAGLCVYAGANLFVDTIKTNPSLFPSAQQNAFLEALKRLSTDSSIVLVKFDRKKWPRSPKAQVIAQFLCYLVEKVPSVPENFKKDLEKIRKTFEENGALAERKPARAEEIVELYVKQILKSEKPTVFERTVAKMFFKLQRLIAESDVWKEFIEDIQQFFRDNTSFGILDRKPALTKMLMQGLFANVFDKKPEATMLTRTALPQILANRPVALCAAKADVDAVRVFTFHAALLALISDEFNREFPTIALRFDDCLKLRAQLDPWREGEQLIFPAELDRATVCSADLVNYIQEKLCTTFPVAEVEKFKVRIGEEFDEFVSRYVQLQHLTVLRLFRSSLQEQLEGRGR